jgi:hypothetical protein
MASKNELESQVQAQELRIKELEDLISSLQKNDDGTSPVPVKDDTSAVLLAELNMAREDAAAERQALTDLTLKFSDLSTENFELKRALQAQQHSSSKRVAGNVLTAKEITYHLHRREIDEDALFVEKLD